MAKRKVAVFDVDGTIFRSSLLIELVETLITERIFPNSAQGEYDGSYKKWLDRRGSYDDYINDVIGVFEKNIKGVAYSDFREVSKKVIAFHKNRVYRYTRGLIRDLKKKGYYLLAISHSPKTHKYYF